MTNIVTAVVTAYCACQVCCGDYADGITASGRAPVEGRTVAANWLPIVTRIRIQGFEVPKVVEDRMARRFSDRVDIYFRRHEDALRFGKRVLRIEIINQREK